MNEGPACTEIKGVGQGVRKLCKRTAGKDFIEKTGEGVSSVDFTGTLYQILPSPFHLFPMGLHHSAGFLKLQKGFFTAAKCLHYSSHRMERDT